METDLQIKIYNALGQQVANEIISTQGSVYKTIDLSNTKTGIYVVELISNESRSTYKIVKQ